MLNNNREKPMKIIFILINSCYNFLLVHNYNIKRKNLKRKLLKEINKIKIHNKISKNLLLRLKGKKINNQQIIIPISNNNNNNNNNNKLLLKLILIVINLCFRQHIMIILQKIRIKIPIITIIMVVEINTRKIRSSINKIIIRKIISNKTRIAAIRNKLMRKFNSLHPLIKTSISNKTKSKTINSLI